MSLIPVVLPLEKNPPEVVEVGWGPDLYWVLKVDNQWQVYTRTCDSPVDSRYFTRLGEVWDGSYAVAWQEFDDDNYDGEQIRNMFFDGDRFIMAEDFTPGTVGDPLTNWDLRTVYRALKLEIPEEIKCDLTRVFWIVGHEYGITVGLADAINCYVHCTTETDKDGIKYHYFHLHYTRGIVKSPVYSYPFLESMNQSSLASYFVDRVRQLPDEKDKDKKIEKAATTEVTPYPIPANWYNHLARACEMV